MAQRHEASPVERLIAPMFERLRKLAGLTRGEYSVEDLQGEALVIALEIQSKRGGTIDPDDAVLRETIIDQLFKAFGRFANRVMRFAVRLDQEERDEDGDFRANAVSARLEGPKSYEPEVALELAEDAAELACAIHAQFSEAVAYYHVFDQFDGDSNAIARYFAITPDTLRVRRTRVETAARLQPSVFNGVTGIPPDFRPRPGRRLRRHAPVRFRRICGVMRPAQLHLFLRYGAVYR